MGMYCALDQSRGRTFLLLNWLAKGGWGPYLLQTANQGFGDKLRSRDRCAMIRSKLVDLPAWVASQTFHNGVVDMRPDFAVDRTAEKSPRHSIGSGVLQTDWLIKPSSHPPWTRSQAILRRPFAVRT